MEMDTPNVLACHGKHLDANGHWYVDSMPGRCQLAGLRVNSEYHDTIRILVFGEEIGAAGIDGEISGCFPLRGLMPHRRQFAGDLVYRKDRDTIVPAV
jgi:hypothetical protein